MADNKNPLCDIKATTDCWRFMGSFVVALVYRIFFCMAKLSLLHVCEHMYSIFNRTLSSLTIIPAANSLHYSDFFLSLIDAHVLHFCFILFQWVRFVLNYLPFLDGSMHEKDWQHCANFQHCHFWRQKFSLPPRWYEKVFVYSSDFY